MLRLKLAKPILIGLTACAVNWTTCGAVLADDTESNQQLKDQMRIMMQQMQELQKQVQALKQATTAPSSQPAAQAPSSAAMGPEVSKAAKPASAEPLFEKFAKGFFGSLEIGRAHV